MLVEGSDCNQTYLHYSRGSIRCRDSADFARPGRRCGRDVKVNDKERVSDRVDVKD